MVKEWEMGEDWSFLEELTRELNYRGYLTPEEYEEARLNNISISHTLDTLLMNKLEAISKMPPIKYSAKKPHVVHTTYWFLTYLQYAQNRNFDVLPYYQDLIEKESLKPN